MRNRGREANVQLTSSSLFLCSFHAKTPAPSASAPARSPPPIYSDENDVEYWQRDISSSQALAAYLDLLLALIAEGIPAVLALLVVDGDRLLVLLVTGALPRVVTTGLRLRDLVRLLLVLMMLLLSAVVIGDASPECGGNGRRPIGLSACG